MAHLPWFKWFPREWLADTRCLTRTARAAWIDMLCIMDAAPVRGRLCDLAGRAWSDDEIARAVGGDIADILEIVAKGVASRDESGAIYSRRMVRDTEAREDDARRQRKSRQHKYLASVTPHVTPDVTPSVTALSQPVSQTDSRDQRPETRDQSYAPKQRQRNSAPVTDELADADAVFGANTVPLDAAAGTLTEGEVAECIACARKRIGGDADAAIRAGPLVMLGSLGCDRSFVDAVRRHASDNGNVAEAFWPAMLEYARMQRRPHKPGGWWREALARNGLDVRR